MPVMCELILGGQRSGKSRCAESRAAAWLSVESRSAVLLATALAGDEEMRSRIDRHRQDRADRIPALVTQEVPVELAQMIRLLNRPERLLVVDCLTLWLTNLLMPLQGPALDAAATSAARNDLCAALREATGPVVLVSNEVGLGISPMTTEARRFVDELGRLHQEVAAQCGEVTLMVAGIEVPVKRTNAT